MVAKGQEGGWGLIVVIKVNRKDHCGDRTVLYLHCVNVSILVVMLHCAFASITTRGNWVKCSGISPYYFLQLHMSPKLFQK